ncbi:uncharacterized protein LOC122258960 isoform X2 [Penaeus japonicus]|uniref:uncharacterized protein LOC122258960 isoform X2 n=1 Tax=Penaeus japonicus TaxID=27405 RepID=UPI001C70C7A6|nr:uncharacterized protein LOC122258960 isoform X2 [Penaeus japonicus]
MEDIHEVPLDVVGNAPPAEEPGERLQRETASVPATLQYARNVSFAVLSLLLHTADVASSVAFAVLMLVHRDATPVVEARLNFVLWASLVLGLHVLAGVLVNFAVLAEGYSMRETPRRVRPLEVLICLIPWARSWWAMLRHVSVALRREVSVSVVERAAHTRLLQAVVEAAPQGVVQTYFLMTMFVWWVPLLSVCLSLVNASFSYTFFVIFKYYDNVREFPAAWKVLLVALNATFTHGGRTFATAMLAFALQPWVAVVWVLFITALNLVRWKFKTWENDRLTRIKIISLLETFFVATTRQKTLYTTFVYVVFTFVFMQRFHVHALAWTVWGITFGALLLGLALSLATWTIYVRAYEELIYPAESSEKQNAEEYDIT